MCAQLRFALPTLPDSLRGLVDLALDLRWSWSHSADELWKTLEPQVWELTHNPWHMLQTMSKTRLEEFAADPQFCEMLRHHLDNRRQTLDAPTWFSKEYPDGADHLKSIAYFSMEFGLSEALPIYSGGLGILAGDFLKVASDLGVPLVGIGILWQQGYFRQALDTGGNQIEFFPFNDPGLLGVLPLRNRAEKWVEVPLQFPRREVRVRVWQVNAGRVKLYLLDSNNILNNPADRGITADLYGGSPEVRLQQEIILGIGGWRLLRELGIEPDVCHLNEGHAALAVLERARCFMHDEQTTFPVALAATRAGNLFTTHTPVAAGFDRFPPDLVKEYLGEYTESLGMDIEELLTLGRLPAADDGPGPAAPDDRFNMAYLAIHGSGAINGVSKLHGRVSRGLFQPVFPRWPLREIPVGHVTNGVHVPSWDSPEADAMWTRFCGKDRWLDGIEGLGEKIRQGPTDEELWAFRDANRRKFIDIAREHVKRQGPIAGSLEDLGLDVACLCDPGLLTLGFARRFTSYKRVNLLLHDPERLERIICGEGSRVQLVLAGKAHPADTAGKAMIKQWTDFIRRCDVRPRVLFLIDYDMGIAEHLVHGVDVWINTPRRPWEASGTSGMKVLVNGGLNLSELDGWWAEGYSPEVGWALGDSLEHGDDPAWDAIEAERLYDLIEHEIIPEFYDRDEQGIPRRWIARVRESMARLAPQFSSNRMMEQYLRDYYLPAAAAYHTRAAIGVSKAGEATPAAQAAAITEWRALLDAGWSQMKFVDYEVGEETAPDGAGKTYSFRLLLDLGPLPPDAVSVQLYAEPLEAPPTRQEDILAGEPPLPEVRIFEEVSDPAGDPTSTVRTYTLRLGTNRPVSDFTPRVIPSHPSAQVPLDESHILWYH